MEKKKSQTSEVLKFMKKYNCITSMQAFEHFGATRLSSIIYVLKKRGYVIDTIRMTCENRYGGTCQYAKYVLISEPEVK